MVDSFTLDSITIIWEPPLKTCLLGPILSKIKVCRIRWQGPIVGMKRSIPIYWNPKPLTYQYQWGSLLKREASLDA